MKEVMMNIKGLKISTVQRSISNTKWIVALHGLQSNKAVFDELFQRPSFGRYSLLAMDCVGFGDSDKPLDFSYDLQEQTDICQALLDELGVQKCHIIGHSLGGMIGTLLLKPLSFRVLSFVNMEGNLVFADCGASADVVKMSQKEFENVGYPALKGKLESSKEPSAGYRRKYIESTPAYSFYKTSKTIVEWSQSEKLVPLFNNADQRRMFMYGSKNVRTANIVSANIPKVEISNAGHFMMFDNPKQTYGAIEEFISL